MDYSPEQIAAFVGAAAWLPQLASWAYKFYHKPQVVIIPDIRAELGYTTLGPIFNIRLAISADTKDVLLDTFRVEVKHESGEIKEFFWQGTKETLNQVRDPTGVLQTVEKDETGIAIKVRPDALADKFFRFQLPEFSSATSQLVTDVQGHHSYLLTRSKDICGDLMNSDKMHSLLNAYRSNFSWRPGKYVITFHCKAIHDSISQLPAKFTFELSPQDVENLRKNYEIFEPYVEWITFKGTEGSITTEPTFEWIYPTIRKS
jgi:hypothetical protein